MYEERDVAPCLKQKREHIRVFSLDFDRLGHHPGLRGVDAHTNKHNKLYDPI